MTFSGFSGAGIKTRTHHSTVQTNNELSNDDGDGNDNAAKQ